MSAVFSDDEILDAINRRDPDELHKVHARFFVPMHVQSQKLLVPAEDAEELTNDIFVYLYSKGRDKQFESMAQLKNYLFRAIVNKSYSFREKRYNAQKRHAQATSDPNIWERDEVFMHTEVLFREQIWNALSNRLQDIFDSAAQRQVQVLKMLYLEKKSVPQIADQLGITDQTVRNLKTKGLDKMTKLLNREDYILQAVATIAYLLSCHRG